MRINDFKRLEDIQLFGIFGDIGHSTDFTGISIDSRSIKRDEIFIALKGDRFDGHDYVYEAFSKGALAAVTEKSWYDSEIPIDDRSNKVFIVVDDSLRTLQSIAHHHRKKFDIPVIGVTGTNGKTTTKDMISAVLSMSQNILKNEGNLNNHIGLPLTIYNMNADHQIAIIEMGINDFGEMERLCEIAEPDYGLITNIEKGHLEFFKSIDGVAEAKGELFTYLSNHGTAFVNLDDPQVEKQSRKVKKKVTYSLNFDAENVGKIIDLRSDGCFQFKLNNQIDIQLNVPGAHNVSNALAAGTVGNQFGISYDDIKHAIEDFQLSANRIQIFRSKEITVLNDTYNSNPGSLIVAFELVESLLKKRIGRTIIVLGDMLELGKMSASEHQMIGEEVARRKFDFLLVYGEESLTTAEAAQAFGMTNVEHFKDKEKLAGKLDDILQPNDIVLVKGSRGMAMEEVLEKTDKFQG